MYIFFDMGITDWPLPEFLFYERHYLDIIEIENSPHDWWSAQREYR